MKLRLVVALGVWIAAASIRGELIVSTEETPSGSVTVYKLTVTPAAEPVPVFKYRFTLREPDYRPGNAANHYMRAFPEGGIESTWKRLEKEYGQEEVHDFYNLETPLSKVPLDKAHQAGAAFKTMIEQYVVPASQRIDCDWGHSIVSETPGPEMFSFLLPEIQSLRGMSRAIMLATRMAVADGDFARAVDLLRMNFRLGENIGKSPFLVSGLVGVAVFGVGAGEVTELIAAKGSPNLYWALAELPRPPVSLRSQVRYELAMDLRVFPVLQDAATTEHSPAEWGRMLAQALQMFGSLGSGPALDSMSAQASMTGLALLTYPDAKRRLIESGMDADKVEAMPVGQVLAIDTVNGFQKITNECEKWQYVPFSQRGAGFDETTLIGANAYSKGLGGMLGALLLPAINSVRSAEVRVQRQLDALRVIEALRMHAAGTGSLPESLDEVKVVPVPVNPATDKPFVYRLNGDTATLELPFEDGLGTSASRYEIQLAK